MVKEGSAERELGGETRSEILLGWPGIDRQSIEMSEEDWGRPLSCSRRIDDDDDDDDEDEDDDNDRSIKQ